MAVQTTYAREHGVAYAGLLADMNPDGAQSKLNKSGGGIPFGHGVVSDGDDAAKLPNSVSVATEFVGVVMRELNRVTETGGTFNAPDQRDMTVITHGIIWVAANAAVSKDDPVYFIVSDGTGTNQGEFSNVIGAGATLAVEITDAKWITSAGAGELAKISLGLGG